MNHTKHKEEIESIITFDNFNKVFNVYSSRNSTINKLTKKLGEPTKCQNIDNSIFSAEWNIPFSDRKSIKNALSINLYYLKEQ